MTRDANRRAGVDHNPWTWNILPGIVLGFASHWVLTKYIEGKENRLGDSTDEDDDDEVLSSVQAPDEELKMILCVNKELGMRAGKIAAQCAHAAVGVVENMRRHNEHLLQQWKTYGAAKIAVQCPNQQQLLEIQGLAREKGIPNYLVTDAGRTQIAAGSMTVLALGPWGKSQLDQLTGHLKLV